MSNSGRMLRYPFSMEARKASVAVARDLRVLTDLLRLESNEYIVEAAENRVLAALDQREIPLVDTGDPRDFLIYTTARLIVEWIGVPRLIEYQAEAESKSVNRHLSKETDRFVMDLCNTSFGWHVRTIEDRAKLSRWLVGYEMEIRFEDFLQVAPDFHDVSWKMANRPVHGGWVPIRRSELDRLISGKFKKLILGSSLEVPPISDRLALAVQRIESEMKLKMPTREPWRPTETTVSALPPCIAQIYEDAVAGRSLSHEPRFTLAAFLLRIGMSEEDVTGVFRASSDFVKSLAEYQVRHIKGKNAGEGYTPPGCRKLQGSGLCPVYLGNRFDPLCEYVSHPLAFYETRAWEISRDVKDHSWYGRKRKKLQSLRST
ncbi:MAG: hypothetical protein HXY34_02845 [Candidatus Thorarchaeota archaeon]|nr:hypothetical protein [Candidatus Thorarchaeota archaeon]